MSTRRRSTNTQYLMGGGNFDDESIWEAGGGDDENYIAAVKKLTTTNISDNGITSVNREATTASGSKCLTFDETFDNLVAKSTNVLHNDTSQNCRQ